MKVSRNQVQTYFFGNPKSAGIRFSWIRLSLDAAIADTYSAFRGKPMFNRVIRNYLSYLDHDVRYVGITLLALLSTSQAGIVSAGTNIWTSNGPVVVSINSLVIDPAPSAILYVGTSRGGIFKSIDNGEHWIAVNTGWANTHIAALAIDPVTPTTLHAGTEDGGVFAIQQEGFKYRTYMPLPLSSAAGKAGTNDASRLRQFP